MKRFMDDVSAKIALNLSKSKDETSEEFAVLKYGVFVVVHIFFSTLFTVLFGILTNTLFPIIIISIMGSVMKKYSGGAHCTSPNRCLVTGTILSYLFVLIGKGIINLQVKISYIIILILLIHSFIILYKKCPVGSINKPLKRKEIRIKLRKRAFFIYSIWVILFIINIVLNKKIVIIDLNYIVIFLSLGLYMQILSLTFVGNKFILFIDKLLLKINI